MTRFVLFNVIFLSTSLFAEIPVSYPLKRHFCEAVKFSLRRYEDLHMPADIVFCVADKDCSYLKLQPWLPATAVNKTALAGYMILTEEPEYINLKEREKADCSLRNPQIRFPLPEEIRCIHNSCVLIFKDS